MKRTLFLSALTLLSSPLATAQSQVTSVAVNPSNSSQVWVCNRDNNSVTVLNANTGSIIAEIPVGSKPRSLAFAGNRVFVANQRGDIPVDVNFVTPFTGAEVRSSVSVIATGSKTVVDTLTDVGTEPYGVVVAPNGAYLAVSGLRSGTIKFYDTSAPYSLLHTHQYLHTLNVIPGGSDINDVDSDGDFLADLGEPRAMAVTSDSSRIWVTHLIPGFVSALDLTLDINGQPTSSTVAEKINLNDYAPHPILNPVPVQTIESQGTPRFLQDIALSPDGSTALIPHLLHNLNHDVNHAFVGLAGDFANRVYPALTILDTGAATWDRLHHELADDPNPAGYVPFGEGKEVSGTVLSFNGTNVPAITGSIDLALRAPDLPGASAVAFFDGGFGPVNIPLGVEGTLYVIPDPFILLMAHQGGGLHTLSAPLGNLPGLVGVGVAFQSALVESGGSPFHLSNATTAVIGGIGAPGVGLNKMGHRAGHPGRVQYNAAGDKALMLNRGSEDIFLYDVSPAGDFTLVNVFPPRLGHVERVALDTTTPLGDLPLGMAILDDASTGNDDALVFIINEITRTLSTLRVDWETGVISEEAGQVNTVTTPDLFTVSERIGQELFEDSSRAQTAGNFNNSCASCHFEGGADGNVWQRPAGPRSTMPVYGGTLGTGFILWKGVRLNMGETGPMFGGENGGHGILTDAEQQGLIDYHEVIPFPINPNLDPITGQYTSLGEEGKDLFHGTNDSGTNPTGRNAGCVECHPQEDEVTLDPLFFTGDVLDPQLTGTHNGLEQVDEFCFTLQENLIGLQIRNVNSGVNVDVNPVDGVADPDRNVDGWNDIEGYSPMNVDDDDDFTRDDPNGYLCPQDPIGDPNGPQKVFTRPPDIFSVPTKMGAFSTGPYFHDHAASSLRTILDPQVQDSNDPVYGDPARIHLQKFFNEFHDLRGEESFVPGASKVQLNLQSTNVDDDIEAVLEYIRSL